MNAVVAFDPLCDLPELPGKAWRHRLCCLDTSHEGFIDRIQWVSEIIQTLYEWRHMEVISREQHVAMLRVLRQRLQADLGAITADDAGLSAAQLPAKQT